MLFLFKGRLKEIETASWLVTPKLTRPEEAETTRQEKPEDGRKPQIPFPGAGLAEDYCSTIF